MNDVSVELSVSQGRTPTHACSCALFVADAAPATRLDM